MNEQNPSQLNKPWKCSCSVCGKIYVNHCGSTLCCGALATIIMRKTKEEKVPPMILIINNMAKQYQQAVDEITKGKYDFMNVRLAYSAGANWMEQEKDAEIKDLREQLRKSKA